MKLSDLKFEYPENLVATQPSRPTRVMYLMENQVEPVEITIQELLSQIPSGDIFVINDTKVLKRRVFAEDKTEVLFLDKISENEKSNTWSVLFPSKKYESGEKIELGHGFKMQLLQKGLPQKVEVFPKITEEDFNQIGELPLPPYIQKARERRHNDTEDLNWYQSAWAKKAGSMAAPTASLHFSEENMQFLRNKGVHVLNLTLHVGLGTFLPVRTENLDHHVMHSEFYSISEPNWKKIKELKADGRKVWALGTTVTRVLESVERNGCYEGTTDILLQEGSSFKIVDRLLTNFHQPESTLLALVSGFVGLNRVKTSYIWAINKKFKLFSYGDLCVLGYKANKT